MDGTLPLSINLRKVYLGPLGGFFHLTSNGLLPCNHCEILELWRIQVRKEGQTKGTSQQVTRANQHRV